MFSNIPRIRGGEPERVEKIVDAVQYSPHTRG